MARVDSATDQAPPLDLAARYGKRPIPRWAYWVAIPLALVALAGLGSFAVSKANPPVRSKLLTWQVTGPTSVSATFEVRRSASQEVYCTLRAQDVRHVDVGYATFRIPPGADYEQPTVRVNTARQATAVELLGCAAGSPPRVVGPQFDPAYPNPAQESEAPSQAQG